MEVRNEDGDMVNIPRMLESQNNIPTIDRINVVVLAHFYQSIDHMLELGSPRRTLKNKEQSYLENRLK